LKQLKDKLEELKRKRKTLNNLMANTLKRRRILKIY
jgi:hypothetical protein